MSNQSQDNKFDIKRPERAALVGLVVNTVLALVKLLGGIFGNSFALIADAIESLSDIFGSFILWGALRYGGKPADTKHPFGHGKAESLAALAVSILILIAGVSIAGAAIHEIQTPHEGPATFTLFVLVGVIAVKEGLFRFAHSSAKAVSSSAGKADAWHHRSDAITSLFAFVGISVSLIGGPAWSPADDWAALLASFVILFNGFYLAREPFSELMDEHAPEVAAQCRQIALEVPAVCEVERCETRKSGRFYRVVMHIEVDPSMKVVDAHALTGLIKANIKQEIPNVASVLVHVEPHGQIEHAENCVE
jgi:cation diffusion facilitator family transporter